MPSLQELKPILKDMLAEDGLGAAIKRLKAALPPDSKAYNDLVLLESELKEANLKANRGSLRQSELDVKYNSLRERFLAFLDALEQRDLDAAQSGKKAKQGSLLYQIPGTMSVAKETRCRVRIAYDEAALLENIELTRDTRIKDVRIAEVMEVELIDPAEQPAFAIRSFNRQEQFVEKDEYTEWVFFVNPLREGQFPLLLRVSVIEKVGDKERVRDIVLEETVVIVADPAAEAGDAGFKSSGLVVGERTPVAPPAPAYMPAPAPYVQLPRSMPDSAPARRAPMQTVAWSLALLIAFSGVAYATMPAVRVNVDWTFATVIDSREAYQNFARRHEGTAKARKALEKVEDIDWGAVQETPSVQAVEEFLELHPEGRHTWEAVEILATLPLPETLQPATLTVLQQYVTQKPAAPAAPKVREMLQVVTPQSSTTKPDETLPAGREQTAPVRIDPEKTEPPKTEPVKQEPEKTNASQPEPAKVEMPAGEITDPIKKLERDMVRVAGGSFTMGCKDAQRDGTCEDDEKPPLTVNVKDFSIGKYEVTQAQWRAVMGGSNPSSNKGCDDCPVENVSWNDIQDFLKKLNALTAPTGKLGYRLPTEAEWEYAARGGNKSKDFLYSGSKTLDAVAWYSVNSGGKTHPVGKKAANELGLYDMSGNVWEWCEDCWHNNYNGAPKDGSAWLQANSGDCGSRVLRGGSWYNAYVRDLRVSVRGGNDPGNRDVGCGFRLARD